MVTEHVPLEFKLMIFRWAIALPTLGHLPKSGGSVVEIMAAVSV